MRQVNTREACSSADVTRVQAVVHHAIHTSREHCFPDTTLVPNVCDSESTDKLQVVDLTRPAAYKTRPNTRPTQKHTESNNNRGKSRARLCAWREGDYGRL